MANEILIFDATGSNADGTDPGSPLTIGPATSYKLRDGTSFPAAPLNVIYANSVDTEGDLKASARYGNRTLKINVAMTDPTGSLLAALQAKLGKLQREGGTLKRTLKNGDVRIYDIVAADGWTPSYDFAYWLRDFVEVEMTLPARPLSRGAEVDLGDNVETSLPWLVFTEATVAGDAPALGRLVIDNDEAGTSMRWFGWAIQQRYYSSASTAALFYQAESCALVAPTATAVGPAGASGGGSNVAKNTALTTSQSSIMYLGTSATAQTHIGTYRVFARVYAPNTNTGTVSFSVTYIPYPQGQQITNPTVDLATTGTPVEQQWAVVDLGLITLPKARKGTQGWIGQLNAASTVSGDDINVDWIALLPAEEGYGEAYALPGSSILVGSSGGTSVEIRWDDTIANDSAGGGYWIQPDVYAGDRLLVPPSGAEARTLQVICRFSRHIPLADGRTLPSVVEDVVGDVSAKLFVTPRYLT